MPASHPETKVHVRATVEKFDGAPPSKVNNALRRVALLGPKLPVEIVTSDSVKGTWIESPPLPPRYWLAFHAAQWVVKWWKKRRKRKRNATD